MKNLIKLAPSISWIISQLALSLICYIIYYIFLENTFNISLNYMQWISIIIICQCVIPRSDNKKQEEQGTVSNLLTFLKNNKIKGGK